MSTIGRFYQYLELIRKHAACDEYSGVARQLVEILVVYACRRIGPGFYLIAEMNKKEYDWKYKFGFLNGREYIKRVKQINDPAYLSISFNKLVEKALLNQFGLPTPKLLGHLHELRGAGHDAKPLKNAEHLIRLIDETEPLKLCFKLVSGYGGSGFRAVEVIHENGAIVLKDTASRKLYQPSDFCRDLELDKGVGYVVEQYFEQHPELAQLNPSSVNTLRISVYQKQAQQPQCYGAFLRIGRNGKVVDNTMSGGIAAKVDLQEGRLLEGLEFSSRSVCHPIHPDSGQPIEGFHVPFFEEAKQLACRALQILPEIYYAGIDVAIGPDGPVIIEFNAMADYSDFAIINIPSRHALS